MKNFRFFTGILCLLAVGLSATPGHAASKTTVNDGSQLTPLGTMYGTNGANPYDAPLFGPDGNLYGTTFTGGSNNAGVIFKVPLAGKLSTLHMFATNGTDGANPASTLVTGADRAMYGTTSAGGTNDAGTIFKITTNGVYTQLYSFGLITNDAGDALDGSTPYAGLTLGRDGNFYGVTHDGGVSNAGTVFQLTPGGSLNTLYSFTGGSDGANPYDAPLVEGATGVFYGTTFGGGDTNNDGTVFQITSGGALTTLWQFSGTNGSEPYAGLKFAADGNLYGTTIEGGTNGNGTIFEITTNGDFTLLFQFNNRTGGGPEGGVTPGPFNNLYGVTFDGGFDGDGSIFAFTTNGQYTTMYSFTNVNDGNVPLSPLVRDAGGFLYGTTFFGGKPTGVGFLGSGVVYRYADLFPPTNSITLPVAGQRWSNIVLNATGTTRENVGVAYVFYSLNGAPWTMATTANAWTNWSAPLILAPGSNTLQSYAVDVNGYYSATNTVSFDYVTGFSTALLTVLTKGQGTVSPDYNNALLLIGANFSMTATGTNGFAFVNWTDGDSNVVSTSATLNFMMNSNLTYVANFADVAPPVVTFATPKSGSRVTNSVGNVFGTASDNLGVSNVFVSVDGGAWTNATLFNSNTNWFSTVTLTPGSNTITAYAVDAAGNFSPTNTLLLDQIPGGTLTVILNGSGTITPNYSNALLAVGNTYTMKIKANNGYAFYYWNSGGLMITNPSLTFVMATNLTNTANFMDIQPPLIQVSTPFANEKYSNSVINCSGFAFDNSLTVGGVMCSMNGSAWFPAASTSGFFYTWTCSNSFPVNVGQNVVKVYGFDGSGNISKTNTTKFTGVVPPQWAAAGLTNMMIQASGQTGTRDLAFGADTFSQMNIFSTGDSGVGGYAYAKTSTNTANLNLTFTATPDMTNDNNPQALALTYSSQTGGTFTNATTLDWGSFTLAATFQDIPDSFSGHNITNAPAVGNDRITYKFGKSSVTVVTNGVTNSVANYDFAGASDVGGLFTLTNSDYVQYLQLNYTGAKVGRYQSSTYDTGGIFQTNDSGSFQMR